MSLIFVCTLHNFNRSDTDMILWNNDDFQLINVWFHANHTQNNIEWYLTRLEAIEAIEKGSIEAAEAPVLAVVTLTSGDAVKLEDAEVVCLWTRKQQILG